MMFAAVNPQLLIDSSTLEPLPAPVWFVELLKALGFTLHLVPMNLWYSGILVAMLLALLGSEQGRRFGRRLMAQMPVIVAMGINFGIVPLLFIQVGMPQVFYPATILMAWFWLAVIVLVTPAYYGVYIYAIGLRQGSLPVWKRAAGWGAAVLFIAVGFIFANAMSMMENIAGWPRLWADHSVHGAALGTALNVADPRLWPRWLMMFGLALTTTAMWIALDAAWFAGREKPEYRGWAKHFAWKLYAAGTAWFLAAGAWYAFGTWSSDARQTMFQSTWAVLTVLTVVVPAGPLALLWYTARGEGQITRGMASLVGLLQFALLGLNAVGRQVVQHVELRPYFDLAGQKADPVWSAMIVFLVSFVLGLGIVAWLIYEVAKIHGAPAKAA